MESDDDLLEQLRADAKAPPPKPDPVNGPVKAKPKASEPTAEDDDLFASLESSAPAKAEPKVEPQPKDKAVTKAPPSREKPPTATVAETAFKHEVEPSRIALRDMFAASALETARATAGASPDGIAQAAYAIADALLKARGA